MSAEFEDDYPCVPADPAVWRAMVTAHIAAVKAALGRGVLLVAATREVDDKGRPIKGRRRKSGNSLLWD